MASDAAGAARAADAPLAPATPAVATAVVAKPARPRASWFAGVSSWPLERRFVAVLILAYIAKQLLSVFLFPAFSGHDEVAHYSYIRTLATEGRLPVLPALDEWRAEARRDQATAMDRIPDEFYPYCYYVLQWHCEADDAQWAAKPPYVVTYLGRYYPSGFQYVANHPPLYYALMTPLYWATGSLSTLAQQYVFRIAAIPFGVATVLLAYALARTLFPGDAFLAVTTPALVAFQPQISYEAAMVNNDIVAIAIVAWLALLLVRGIRDNFPRSTCLWLGVALGVGLLAKSTSLIAAPVVAFAIILAVGWRNVRGWVERGALVVAPAALLAAPWYIYLYRTYGSFDLLERIATLQGYWNKPDDTFLGLLTDSDFVVARFHETWGQFGWRKIPLDPTLLWVIAVPLVVATFGLGVYLVTAGRDLPSTRGDHVEQPRRWQWHALATLALLCVVAYLAVVQFGTQFALTQARYFFPVATAAALLTMLGLRTLLPARARPAAQGIVVASLLVLTIVIFSQYVLPFHLSIVEEPGYGYYTYTPGSRTFQLPR